MTDTAIQREWISPDGAIRLIQGDCLRVLPLLPECSVDSIVTDPPYGLSFMGKDWDHGVPGEHFWREAIRVAKPGAHLLAFGGTRTFHRLACAIEDAGWEIRDCLMWVYGSGFPKSLDVSKAIDKAAGAERKVTGTYNARGFADVSPTNDGRNQWAAGDVSDKIGERTAPATDAAAQWAGWGTALKPAWEPIIMARKRLVGTVAANVLEWGTGGINVDGCRIETNAEIDDPRLGDKGAWATDKAAQNVYEGGYAGEQIASSPLGRWPANLMHDGSEEVLQHFPSTTSGKPAGIKAGGKLNVYGEYAGGIPVTGFGDSGSAARFFYCAKASKKDRDEGLADAERRKTNDGRKVDADNAYQRGATERLNHHPTVKPTDLMRYLCRLVTPPGGVVLDPFTGSGSTGKAAVLEGFRFTGIELDSGYLDIAEARCKHSLKRTELFNGKATEAVA